MKSIPFPVMIATSILLSLSACRDIEADVELIQYKEIPPETPSCTGNQCNDKGCDMCEDGQIQCQNNTRYACKPDSNHCLNWELQESCEPGFYCDETKDTCQECQNECNPEDKVCYENNIRSCKTDSFGCYIWNESEHCNDDEHCNQETLSCAPGCLDLCTESETRCLNGSAIQTCTRSEFGCTLWKTTETCEYGSFCTDDKPYCAYLCDNDCEKFSIILMPDIQAYDMGDSGLYTKMAQWIADNKDTENIRFVMHTGDIVNTNVSSAYEIAQKAQNIIAQAGIPYSIAPGDNEYKQGEAQTTNAPRSRSLFSQYFNDESIHNSAPNATQWFHGFHDDTNMAASFEIGNIKFAVIALEYAPRKDVLCWADNLIQQNFSDRHVFLTTHAYLSSNSRGNSEDGEEIFEYFNPKMISEDPQMPSGADGEAIFHELAARHSNIAFIASSHFCEIAHRKISGYSGNTILESTVSYQCEKPCPLDPSMEPDCCDTQSNSGNGNGWFQQIIINPKNTLNDDGSPADNIEVKTRTVLNLEPNASHLYCSTEENDYYQANITRPDHTYSFHIDFTTPIEYNYQPEQNLTFGTREIQLATGQTPQKTAVKVNPESGAFVVVWETQSSQGENQEQQELMAKMFCAGGCSDTTPAIRINTTTNNPHHNPDIAMDNEGNFVVVWEVAADNNTSHHIHMRGFDHTGNERFPEQTINSIGAGHQINPAIAMNAKGQFVVAWHDESTASEHPQIFIRGFNSDGTERFHDKNILDNADASRTRPDIAMAPDGQFVVTYEESALDTPSIIRAIGFAPDGTERLPAFTVNSTDSNSYSNPSIDMNDDGDFIIMYTAHTDETADHLDAHGFDTNGIEFFPIQTVTASENNAKLSSSTVCLDNNRSTVFVWQSQPQSEIILPSSIQRNTAISGTLTGIDNISDSNRDQTNPSLSCAPSGNHVFVYTQEGRLFIRGYHSINKP